MGPGSPDIEASSAAPVLTPRGCGLPPAASNELERAGFVVAGVLRARDYDDLVPPAWRSAAWMPDARSALVLGTAGGRFEAGWRSAPSWQTESDPIDRFARGVLERFVRALDATAGERAGPSAKAHLYCDRRAGSDGRPVFADFVTLARACGLGVPSRLGLLLHRDFGPWWSVRALALTRLELPATGHASAAAVEPGFDPCSGCSAPCESACPGAAVGVAGFDVARCASQRLRSETCAVGCAARRACPVGGAHALRREDESVYAAASLAWIRAGAQAASR